jgi:molybdopterin-guanine dinucleotide biosynthesis protein A
LIPAISNSLITVLEAVIFAGGNSTRFGSNKMLFAIDGIPMANHIEKNMQHLGPVSLIGATDEDAQALSLKSHRGAREGQGPLGALIDALHNTNHEKLLVSPCDTPFFGSDDFSRLSLSLRTGVDVAVAHDGRTHWLLSCWRVASTVSHLEKQFDSGERAIHRAVAGLVIAEVPCSSLNARNINTPTDLVQE